MPLPAWIGTVLQPLTELVDSLHFSGEEKERARLALISVQVGLAEKTLDYEARLAEAQAQIVTAEAKGESWLQRNWRPITALVLVFIVAWDYVFHPFANWASTLLGGPPVPVLEIPEGLWALLQICLGGYIASRGLEKIADRVGGALSQRVGGGA